MCELYARATERAALGERAVSRRRQPDERRGGGVLRHAVGARRRCRSRAGWSSERTRMPSKLVPGSEIGAGGEAVDLALDPLEGRGVVARGGQGAMSIVAVAGRDSMLPCPTCTCGSSPWARVRVAPSTSCGRSKTTSGDRRGVRPCAERHHDDRPRPPASRGSDRGHPPCRRAHQADPRRHRDRRHLRGRSAARTTTSRSASAAPGRR